MDLSEAIRNELLNPAVWQEALMRFAKAANLAVLLTDADGRPLGNCLNPQPTWLKLRSKKSIGDGECPFCIEPSNKGNNCAVEALKTAATVTRSDGSGLVHLAVPLFLFNQRLGALLTGQVFDQYPNHLQLHNLARKLQCPADELWRSARLEHPMRMETLRVFGSLLETFGAALVQAQYQKITDDQRLADMTRLNDSSSQLATEQRELATERKKQIDFTNEVLEETRQELRDITGRVVSAQEEERQRMARELHDGIGHGIVLFQFDVHALQQMVRPSQPVDAQFQALADRIRQIAEDVRQLSHDLHPAMLEDLGLEAAIGHLAENVRKHHSMSVEFTAQNIPETINAVVALGLYRIIQEALQNIMRHAGPAAVRIVLSGKPGALELSITDTGKGFDSNARKPGLGLINMSDRAELLGGDFVLESHPGQGTKINVRVPLLQSA